MRGWRRSAPPAFTSFSRLSGRPWMSSGLIRRISRRHHHSGFRQSRLAHHPRSERRRVAAWPWRHAVPASGTSIPTRVHGAFVSDQEVHRVVGASPRRRRCTSKKSSMGRAIQSRDFLPTTKSPGRGGGCRGRSLYDEAVRIVTETRKASISGVSGASRSAQPAARLVEAMEAAGFGSIAIERRPGDLRPRHRPRSDMTMRNRRSDGRCLV